MPRYFFDIHDSQGEHRDDIGLDLPDMDAAITEAKRTLAEITRDNLLHEGEPEVSILIRDGDEGPVRLAVTLTTERPE